MRKHGWKQLAESYKSRLSETLLENKERKERDFMNANQILIKDTELESLKEAAVILDSHSTRSVLEQEPPLKDWAEQVARVLTDITAPRRNLGKDYQVQ